MSDDASGSSQGRIHLREQQPFPRVTVVVHFYAGDDATRDGETFTSLLNEAYRRAGVTGKSPTHALRHTMASELMAAGTPIHVVQKHMGHSSPIVTLGVYAHAQRDGLKAAADAVARYRARG